MPKKKHLRGVSGKEQRKYEHIKESAQKEGRYGKRAKEVAARTVMKEHKQKDTRRAISPNCSTRKTYEQEVGTSPSCSSIRARVSLPAVAMHEVGERAPLRAFQRLHRTVGGIAEGDQVIASSVAGIPEKAARQFLVVHGGVAAPDASVGGGDHHAHDGLTQIEGDRL